MTKDSTIQFGVHALDLKTQLNLPQTKETMSLVVLNLLTQIYHWNSLLILQKLSYSLLYKKQHMFTRIITLLITHTHGDSHQTASRMIQGYLLCTNQHLSHMIFMVNLLSPQWKVLNTHSLEFNSTQRSINLNSIQMEISSIANSQSLITDTLLISLYAKLKEMKTASQVMLKKLNIWQKISTLLSQKAMTVLCMPFEKTFIIDLKYF